MGAENYVYGENENNVASHDCPKTMFGQCTYDFWHDHATGESIHDDVFYSTNYYTTRAVGIVKNHTMHAPPGQSLWLHLMYQGVHSPYVDSPTWERIPNNTESDAFWDPHPFGDMLRAVDTGIGNYTAAIKEVPGLWEETLMICTSDNGGIGPGNNFPLRGHKATPWCVSSLLSRLCSLVISCLVPRPHHLATAMLAQGGRDEGHGLHQRRGSSCVPLREDPRGCDPRGRFLPDHLQLGWRGSH